MAATEPAPAHEHTVRVPTAQQTAESIRRAQRALDEIAARDAADQARAEQEQAEELARRHAHDAAHDDAFAAEQDAPSYRGGEPTTAVVGLAAEHP